MPKKKKTMTKTQRSEEAAASDFPGSIPVSGKVFGRDEFTSKGFEDKKKTTTKTETSEEAAASDFPGSIPVSGKVLGTDEFTYEDIEDVQNLISECIVKYMSKEETALYLYCQLKIDIGITNFIWSYKERKDVKFFEGYYLMLIVRNQIVRFNKLLARQYELLKEHGLLNTPSADKVALALERHKKGT